MKITIELTPEEALKLTGADFIQKIVQEQVKETVKKTEDVFRNWQTWPETNPNRFFPNEMPELPYPWNTLTSKNKKG